MASNSKKRSINDFFLKVAKAKPNSIKVSYFIILLINYILVVGRYA